MFLLREIWPRVKDRAIVHDDQARFSGTEKPFPTKLEGGLFVGQQYGSNNRPLEVPI